MCHLHQHLPLQQHLNPTQSQLNLLPTRPLILKEGHYDVTTVDNWVIIHRCVHRLRGINNSKMEMDITIITTIIIIIIVITDSMEDITTEQEGEAKDEDGEEEEEEEG